MRAALMAVAVFVLHAVSASAQIDRAMQMNTEQIRARDRGRTVVLLPGGILEQHGPYLPSFSTRSLTDPSFCSSGRIGRPPSASLSSAIICELYRAHEQAGVSGAIADTRAMFEGKE